MSFGVSNLGVINQRQAPAIWESDFADFPANFIAGRILIALDAGNAGIYIDGVGERYQIANGKINFLNGLGTVGFQTPTTQTIGLGGELIQETTLDVSQFILRFNGAANETIINNDGLIVINGHFVPSMVVNSYNPISANAVLNFINEDTGAIYRVLAEEVL